MKRIGPNEIHHYGEIYEFVHDGELLKDDLPKSYARACRAAVAETFDHVEDMSIYIKGK
jgi:hypothetical protein